MIVVRFLVVAMLLTAGAIPAGAAPIITPALAPPTDGRLACHVVNGDPSKTLTFICQIFAFDGTAVVNIEDSLPPLQSVVAISHNDDARFCVVTITSGPKKSARVSLLSGTVTGAVIEALEGR